MSGRTNKASQAAVWVIILLLIVGLGGFGVTNFGGTIRSVGAVGDKEISVDAYARALQQELRVMESQFGQSLTMEQARLFGLDQIVLERLFSTAALDNETARIGLSVGDNQVRTQVTTNSSFQGATGGFDREAYRFALRQIGYTEAEYEDIVREETARTLLQSSIISGIGSADTLTNSLLDYQLERRSFDYIRLDETNLADPLPAPTEEQLTTYYQGNTPDFTDPEKKSITYIWLTPEMLVDTVTIDEEGLRTIYDARIEEYERPERRLVERLIFSSQEEAEAASAALIAGETTYSDLVADAGFSLGDVDMGDVMASDLGDAADGVFALTEPGTTGVLQSEFGPAIFRMNGILAAQSTSFEDARAELLPEYASDRARRVIEDMLTDIDDLLAGGATLEEIANETDMQLGQIDWWDGLGEGIAAYNPFREAAGTVSMGDFAELAELDDGGIFALRLDEVIEPALLPLDDVRNNVIDGWEAQENDLRVQAYALDIMAQLIETTTADALGLTVQTQTDLLRTGYLDGTPEGLINEVFEMADGETRVIAGFGSSYIVTLNSIQPPADDEATAERRARLSESITQGIAQDVFEIYARALQDDAGISINQTAISAVQAQLP
ncbi:peptidylprolyl isomerase [Cochlodiniinecator piscidefendens]|uniref:peptidylprolyl isomerase n=1 Tax=Cochlodiniinecator piscidefendens TaxID=2715756 RepID=UPI00140B4846|nr:peptidylprolyl isomerase [Cochlodiniinecator piscidefendens]